MVSDIIADDRNHRHRAHASHQTCRYTQKIIAFSLQKCLRKAIHHSRHDQQQSDPEIEGDDAEQKERKAEVADMNPSAARTDGKLFPFPKKGTLRLAVAMTELKLVLLHTCDFWLWAIPVRVAGI